MKYTYQHGRDTYTVDIEKTSEGYRAILNGQEYPLRIIRAETGALTFEIGDHPETVFYAADGPHRWVAVDGRTFQLTYASGSQSRRDGHVRSGEKEILAPMPGHVRAVQVAEGSAVTQGQTLFILEAMKMEIRIQAPRSGQVARVAVKQGQSVEREQLLAEIK